MSRHPDRCVQCGSNYGHFRGCSLDNLSLSPERETLLRTNPEAASTYDVECLLQEIDRIRKDRDKIFRNAVDAMKAKETELDRLRTELAEANKCWHGALEVQAELEAEVVSLRTMAANLRLDKAHE